MIISNLLISKLKIFLASINSKILFIIVAESIEIFLPIFQFGCFSANFALTFFTFNNFLYKNGPPEAVK